MTTNTSKLQCIVHNMHLFEIGPDLYKDRSIYSPLDVKHSSSATCWHLSRPSSTLPTLLISQPTIISYQVVVHNDAPQSPAPNAARKGGIHIEISVGLGVFPIELYMQLMELLRDASKTIIAVGTGCSGFGIIMQTLEAVRMHWKNAHDFELNSAHEFDVEVNENKRAFLIAQFPGLKILFEDVGQVVVSIHGFPKIHPPSSRSDMCKKRNPAQKKIKMLRKRMTGQDFQEKAEAGLFILAMGAMAGDGRHSAEQQHPQHNLAFAFNCFGIREKNIVG